MEKMETEQMDAAERNIIHLNEIKAAISARIQLLKIKQQQSNDCSIVDTNNQESKQLMASLLKKTNLENGLFHIALKSFIKENIVNNDSEDPQMLDYKERFHELLQQLNQSTTNIQALIRKLRSLKLKHKEINEELFKVQNEHEQVIKEKHEKNKDKTLEETYQLHKSQLEERVQKINVMISIINGLVYSTQGINWTDDPELVEGMAKCRNVYTLDK